MTARNDITGDSLVSKSSSTAFREGWERIFGKKVQKETPRVTESSTLTAKQHDALRELTDHIKKIQCPDCDGHGWRPDVAASTCPHCGGEGLIDK